MREATLLALSGATLGLAASTGLSRLLSANLFHVSPHDPPTLAAIFMLFLTVSLLASIFPANRAASIDPMQVLRNE